MLKFPKMLPALCFFLCLVLSCLSIYLRPLADARQAKKVFSIQDASSHNLTIAPKSIPSISLQMTQIKFTM